MLRVTEAPFESFTVRLEPAIDVIWPFPVDELFEDKQEN